MESHQMRQGSSSQQNFSDPLQNCPSLKVWSNSKEAKSYQLMCSTKKCSWVIPLGGNTFLTSPKGPPDEEPEDNFISRCGIANWSDVSKVISTFFHCTRPGYVQLALRLRVPSGNSRIRVMLTHVDPPTSKKLDPFMDIENEIDDSIQVRRNESGRQEQTTFIDITGPKWQLVPCGKFLLPVDGYMRIDLQGENRTGQFYADVTHLLIVPESDWFQDQTCVKFVADPSDFYFGRRGPSVHLRYVPPPETEFEYFYTEVAVPEGQDIIGSYFCAAGFRGGYFGIQVNSETERRVLFSIWSEWNSDNPGDVPDDYKVILIKKGPGVIDGDFGDEGTGAQSYLVYPWVSQRTYRFLVFATKSGTADSIYTAWFNPTGQQADWMLIASFFKPKDSTFLRDLYAFSENFIPEQGHLERHCLYGNQWIYDLDRNWRELTRAEFTADATANSQNRMDISGGLHETGNFYLRNCGFFSDSVKANTFFDRPAIGIAPDINFGALP